MDYSQLNTLLGGGDEPGGKMGIFEKNIKALSIRSPQVARAVSQACADDRLCFVQTDEGTESVEIDGIAMASKRKPMHEARRLADRIDPKSVACCAVVGFGMGYHCGTILERLGSMGMVICYEPDLKLLCGVLERVDYSQMFETGRFYLVTNPNDPARLTEIFTGSEAIIGLGVEIVAHPPSVNRLAQTSDEFGQAFSNVLRATRTHVVTTLANSRVTFRNALMNLDHYASSAGVESLKDTCKGMPAVVVSAGPSLERNIELLADPKVRESVVVIAVQTVLKQMLSRGIKPNFVAALDYHEVSKRFYEGLTAQDVEGVRLVVEAKANPAILDAFPGEVLCASDAQLNSLLGDGLSREMGELAMGGTVAHLCYYFARYLGCDPVIFIGQDLGFTDGQYYSAGAAIHQVWSGELNAHNTLEMMEWQRIVRMRSFLRKREDVDGRGIYLDEQMSTYLAQFEFAFQQDSQQGLTVIDATEGGVRKQHTTVMTLEHAIAEYGHHEPIGIPETKQLCVFDENRRQMIQSRLESIIDDCERIAHLSGRSIGLLGSMLDHQTDQRRVNKLIGEVQQIRDQVSLMNVAYGFTESINQVGVLNRLKRDRLIGLESETDAMGRQRLQIERDIINVEWTRDAAQAVAEQLRSGRDAFLGLASKQTNELSEVDQELEDSFSTSGRNDQDGQSNQGDQVVRRSKIHALVMADPEFGGLGTPRALGEPMYQGLNALELTIARLDECEQIDGITIVTPRPDAIRGLLGSGASRKPMTIAGVDRQLFRDRASRIGSARVQSSDCWRGSIGMLGVYDEQVHPVLLSEVMNTHRIDACAIVGADWAMIDPKLVDETVLRYRCQDAEKRIAFSQAPPGLGTMVVDRVTIDSLADSLMKKETLSGQFSTLGMLVGYVPIVPQFDPIAKGMCVQIEPEVRDLGVRVIADTPARRAMMCQAYQSIGVKVADAGLMDCARAYHEASGQLGRGCPRTIVLETCTGRLADGQWGAWKRRSLEPIERKVLSFDRAHELMKEIGALRTDAALVFDGVGDPLMHPQGLSFAQLAKEDGIACVELRTNMLRGGLTGKDFLESGIDILSVDVLAEKGGTYAAITGQDRLSTVYDGIQSVVDAMNVDRLAGELSPVWLVPRLTRCDAVYDDVEAFYDKWLMICGSAVIDPMPRRVEGQRIKPLPIPSDRQRQLDLSTMHIQCDGAVVDRFGNQIRSINVFDDGIEQAYQRACAAMRSSIVEPKAGVSLTKESAA